MRKISKSILWATIAGWLSYQNAFAEVLVNNVPFPDPLVVDAPLASPGTNLTVNGDSVVTLLEGALVNEAFFSGASRLGIVDGTVVDATMTENSTLDLQAGTFLGALVIKDNVTANVSGGVFNRFVQVVGSANATFTGGETLFGDFEIRENATVEINGGRWFTTFAGDHSEVHLTSGDLHGQVFFLEDSTGTIRGGDFGDSLAIEDRAEFTLYARKADFTGSFFSGNESVENQSVLGESLQSVDGFLEGEYADGAPFSISLGVGQEAFLHITPVPESHHHLVPILVFGVLLNTKMRRN